jgi:hypothetical protein
LQALCTPPSSSAQAGVFVHMDSRLVHVPAPASLVAPATEHSSHVVQFAAEAPVVSHESTLDGFVQPRVEPAHAA